MNNTNMYPPMVLDSATNVAVPIPFVPKADQIPIIFQGNDDDVWLPEIMQNAIYEVYGMVQSPLPIIPSVALSAAAFACHHVDVKIFAGPPIPTSLYILISAESGSRKTSTYNKFFQGVRAVEAKIRKERAQQEAEQEAQLIIWKEKHKTLLKRINKELANDNEGGLIDLQGELEQHLNCKPVLPEAPQIIYSDTTIQAFLSALHKKSPYAILSSDEGGMVFSKISDAYFAHMNTLWDGGPIQMERKTGPSFEIEGARVSLSVMTQPAIVEKLKNKQDQLSRYSGFFARMLITQPDSNQGTRHFNGGENEDSAKYLREFNERVTELLQEAEAMQGERIVLGFLPEAKLKWVEFCNQVGEHSPQKHGYCSDISDFAAKAGNHAARIAAVVHYFSGKKGDIDVESTEMAIKLTIFYLKEFKKVFGEKTEFQLQQEYGDLLRDWLMRKYQLNGQMKYYVSDLLQRVPSKLRKKDELGMAITKLLQTGEIHHYIEGKKACILFKVSNYHI